MGSPGNDETRKSSDAESESKPKPQPPAQPTVSTEAADVILDEPWLNKLNRFHITEEKEQSVDLASARRDPLNYVTWFQAKSQAPSCSYDSQGGLTQGGLTQEGLIRVRSASERFGMDWRHKNVPGCRGGLACVRKRSNRSQSRPLLFSKILRPVARQFASSSGSGEDGKRSQEDLKPSGHQEQFSLSPRPITRKNMTHLHWHNLRDEIRARVSEQEGSDVGSVPPTPASSPQKDGTGGSAAIAKVKKSLKAYLSQLHRKNNLDQQPRGRGHVSTTGTRQISRQLHFSAPGSPRMRFSVAPLSTENAVSSPPLQRRVSANLSSRLTLSPVREQEEYDHDVAFMDLNSGNEPATPPRPVVPEDDDGTNVNELASYMENSLFIPKQMSPMAENMYN